MSKKIDTEWKSFDASVIAESTSRYHSIHWNKHLNIPSQMHVEFQCHDKILKHIGFYTQEHIDKKMVEVTPYFQIWDGNNWQKVTPDFVYENVKIRPNPSDAKNYNRWIDEIKVGDFVKFKGQRSKNIWKKIVDITENTLMCLQYGKPIDDMKYFDGNSSETLIWKIQEKFND